MKYPIALMLGLSALIAAGCDIPRSDLQAPHTTAGPSQDAETMKMRTVEEGIRPFAF